jgi:carboxymethylenebutenolidase
MRTDDSRLTPAQQAMVELWDQHMAAEFGMKSVEATMATITANPVVVHVPVMTGGVGLEEVRHLYGTSFIPAQPPYIEIVPVSRTVGHNRIADELVGRFTHTAEMPWLLPGIQPTGKRVEVAVVVIVEFEDGRIVTERIYWDQASVLAQVGLVHAARLPIAGRETAEKVLRPSKLPSNTLN